jgi:hypothetical protein
VDVVAEDVRLHDLDVVVAGDDLAQRGDQVAVELDGDDPECARGERDRERAHASADLQELVVAIGDGGFGDRVAQCGVDEKVLAEAMLEGDAVPAQQGLEVSGTRRINQ